MPVVAVTETDAVAAALNVVWGVTGVVTSIVDNEFAATGATARRPMRSPLATG